LINLGFEWLIQGNDNHNAEVEVSYRKQGETQWKRGLPLLRLHGERIYQSQGVFDVISPNMFAGSILDLEPDTEYVARFVMSDPDGFQGQGAKTVTKIATVRTRSEPMPYSGGRVFHVYPPTRMTNGAAGVLFYNNTILTETSAGSQERPKALQGSGFRF
jgi:hypothetical protein